MEKPRKKKLLPCPFCGNKGQVFHPQGTRAFSVCCEMAGCIGDTGYSNTEESAIDNWNTRPAMSTWLEGEIVTKEELTAVMGKFPHKSQYFYDEVQAVHAFLTRKLTGKV